MGDTNLVHASIERARHDFDVFCNKRTFAAQDELKLLSDITDLNGWYRVEPSNEIAKLVGRMISFGESKLWSMGGARVQFEMAKKKTGVG